MVDQWVGELPYQAGEGWIQIQVRVQPRSSSERIGGIVEGALRVHLTAPPVEGKANKALQRFLARLLGIPKWDVEIVAGEISRSKRVRLHGITSEGLAKLVEQTRDA